MTCHTTVHPCRWPPRVMKYMYSTIHPLFSNIKICPFYFKNLTKTSKISKIHGAPGWNHNSEMWWYCAIGVQERQIQGPMEVIPPKIMSITIDSRTLFEKNKVSVFSEWTVVDGTQKMSIADQSRKVIQRVDQNSGTHVVHWHDIVFVTRDFIRMASRHCARSLDWEKRERSLVRPMYPWYTHMIICRSLWQLFMNFGWGDQLIDFHGLSSQVSKLRAPSNLGPSPEWRPMALHADLE